MLSSTGYAVKALIQHQMWEYRGHHEFLGKDRHCKLISEDTISIAGICGKGHHDGSLRMCPLAETGKRKLRIAESG